MTDVAQHATIVSGPHPPSTTVRRCDIGGEALPTDEAWWLVKSAGRGWTGDHGAVCATHSGQRPVKDT